MNFFYGVFRLFLRTYEWARGWRHHPLSSSPPERLLSMITSRARGRLGAYFRAIYLFAAAVLKFRERLLFDRVNFSAMLRPPVNSAMLRGLAQWQQAVLEMRPAVPKAHLNIHVADAHGAQLDRLVSTLLLSDAIGNISFFLDEHAASAARTSASTVREESRAVAPFDLNADVAVDVRELSSDRLAQVFSASIGFDGNVNTYLKVVHQGAVVVALSLPESDDGFCDAALGEWRDVLEAFEAPIADVSFVILNAVSSAVSLGTSTKSAVSFARVAGLSFAEALRLAQQADVFVGELDAFGIAALCAHRPGVYLGDAVGIPVQADSQVFERKVFQRSVSAAQACGYLREILAYAANRPRKPVTVASPRPSLGSSAGRNEKYTLIIPTYNRPALLARLLGYLERQRAPFPILILDSSHSDALARNKESIGSVQLDVRHSTYDQSLDPYGKIKEGLGSVDTAYCSICADDDIVIVPAIERSVVELERRLDFSIAHGYYFNFIEQDAFDLSRVMYRGKSIEDSNPLARLRTLLAAYEAVFYGVFRTPVMRSAFQDVDKVGTVLGKELLTAALSIVAGKSARIPCFYYGRNTGESLSYSAWHPHQILAQNPELLFSEFPVFRSLLARAVRALNPGSTDENVEKTIDLIFLRYLEAFLRHDVLDLMLDMSMSGQQPGAIYTRVWDIFVRGGDAKRPLKPLLDNRGRFIPERFGNGRPRDYSHTARAWDGQERKYRLRYSFMFPGIQPKLFAGQEDLTSLLQTLNSY